MSLLATPASLVLSDTQLARIHARTELAALLALHLTQPPSFAIGWDLACYSCGHCRGGSILPALVTTACQNLLVPFVATALALVVAVDMLQVTCLSLC